MVVRMITSATILFRIIVTFVLSFLFGIERQKAHKPIGFGTFIFVAVGSCALALTALNVGANNPLPLLSAIVTGIGFLGAGALMKTTDRIFGFTSAATIWVFAIFGLLIGVGEYLIATIMYIFVWIVFFYDFYLEKKGIGSYQKKIEIVTKTIVSEKEIKKMLLTTVKQYKLTNVFVDKVNERVTYTYLIEGTREQLNSIPQKLFDKGWFASFKID